MNVLSVSSTEITLGISWLLYTSVLTEADVHHKEYYRKDCIYTSTYSSVVRLPFTTHSVWEKSTFPLICQEKAKLVIKYVYHEEDYFGVETKPLVRLKALPNHPG